MLRTLQSNRFVTGVTSSDGELWHATWENEESEIRRVDPETGKVLDSMRMPEGTFIAGMEAGGDRFYCGGGGKSAVVRAVKRR